MISRLLGATQPHDDDDGESEQSQHDDDDDDTGYNAGNVGGNAKRRRPGHRRGRGRYEERPPLQPVKAFCLDCGTPFGLLLLPKSASSGFVDRCRTSKAPYVKLRLLDSELRFMLAGLVWCTGPPRKLTFFYKQCLALGQHDVRHYRLCDL
jgi:hypothetical protein